MHFQRFGEQEFQIEGRATAKALGTFKNQKNKTKMPMVGSWRLILENEKEEESTGMIF